MHKMTSRLPRYQRVGSAPAFVLTERDEEIIRWVHSCRYLAGEQVARLPSAGGAALYLFPRTTKSNVDKRLRLLFHHGYLWRIARPVARGSSPAIYCLDTRGRDFIAHDLQVEKRDVKWERWLETEKDLIFLSHSLAINDFRLSIELAARLCGHQVVEWIDERALKSAAMKDYIGDPKGEGKIPIVPDSYFALRLSDGRLARHFLELDRGRQEQKAFRRKIRGYIQYVATGRYQERYQARSLRVLVVTTEGDKRLADLKRWTEVERGGDLFWFTTLDRATPEHVLTGEIWQVGGQIGAYGLLS